jgi:hypothetical protein
VLKEEESKMLNIEIIEDDRQEAAAFLQKNRSLEPLKRRAERAFEETKAKIRDPFGASQHLNFLHHVFDPVRRLFVVRYRAIGNPVERAAWCYAAIRFCEACASLSLAEMSGSGAVAAHGANRAPASGAIPASFSAQSFIARLAQSGVTLSVDGETLLLHGTVHPQVRNQIAARRRELLDYLTQPAQVIE